MHYTMLCRLYFLGYTSVLKEKKPSIPSDPLKLAKTNESTTLILHGIPGVGESKKSRGDLANFRSAIRDFSSVCGTLFRDMGFFFVLRNRTGGFFRSNGIISVLRNTVPRHKCPYNERMIQAFVSFAM